MFGTLQISSILDKNERIEETIPLRATRWQAWVKSKFDTGSASTAQLVELAEAFPFAQSRRVHSLRAVRTSRTSVEPSLESASDISKHDHAFIFEKFGALIPKDRFAT